MCKFSYETFVEIQNALSFRIHDCQNNRKTCETLEIDSQYWVDNEAAAETALEEIRTFYHENA